MTRIAAYARVSTSGEHSTQKNSLETQIDYFSKYADTQEDMELYKLYHDSLSGTNWEKRKGFREMLYDAGINIGVTEAGTETLELSDRKPLFDRIVTKDISRFTRNISDEKIFKLLRDKGVFVDFTNAKLSTENSSEEFMLQILATFSQRESTDRSEKTTFGLKESAKHGHIRMKDNLYGYRLVKEMNTLITLPDGEQRLSNTLEIVPDEADVVRMIYNLYIEGNGLRKIIQYLESNNIRRNGKPFAQTTLNRMLSNPAYKGVLIRNKLKAPPVFSISKKVSVKEESEWQVFENRFPAIIDNETFDKVQQVKMTRLNADKKGRKTQTGKYAGKIKCGICGKFYTQNSDKYGNLFLNCATKKAKGVKYCSSPNIKNDILNLTVKSFIDGQLKFTVEAFKRNYIDELTEFKNELLSRVDTHQLVEADSLRLEIDELNESKKRLLKLYISGKHDEETLDSMSTELDNGLKELHEKLIKSTLTNEEIQEEANQIDETINQLILFRFDKEITEENVMNFISSIHVKYVDFLFFDFEFKIFENLNQIVKKYKIKDKVYTFNMVSVLPSAN